MSFTPEQLHAIDLIGDHIAIFLIIIVLIFAIRCAMKEEEERENKK